MAVQLQGPPMTGAAGTSGASLAAFPPPPPHWRLFGPGKVLVLPPRPPTVPCYVFGEQLTLEPVAVPVDADEWLCDPEAEDLGAELLSLQRSLQTCSLDLLECLLQNPSEYPVRLRELARILKSMRGLLHVLRAREARALVLQQLREQVARKRKYLEDATSALPGLEERLTELAAAR
ncbi:unnamed protein product, partial [Polarella glacialis]